MNRDLLALLSCSSSLAIMLVVADRAVANTTKPDAASAPESAGLVDINVFGTTGTHCKPRSCAIALS